MGQRVTAIWIASHLGILNKNPNIQSEIFDFSFYEDWTDNENKFNTKNLQYLESDYEKQIVFKKIIYQIYKIKLILLILI